MWTDGSWERAWIEAVEPRRLFSAGLDGLDCGLSELPPDEPLVIDVPAEDAEVVALPWFGEEVDPALVDPVPEDELIFTTFIVEDPLVDPLPADAGEPLVLIAEEPAPDDVFAIPDVPEEELMFTTTIVDEPLADEPVVDEPVVDDIIAEPTELENPDVIFYTAMPETAAVVDAPTDAIAPPPVTVAPAGYKPATYSDLAIGDTSDDDALLA